MQQKLTLPTNSAMGLSQVARKIGFTFNEDSARIYAGLCRIPVLHYPLQVTASLVDNRLVLAWGNTAFVKENELMRSGIMRLSKTPVALPED